MQLIVTDVVVCWSVCYSHEPCKNDWTDPDAAWDVDLVGPMEACIR